jgi:hypothetical protein
MANTDLDKMFLNFVLYEALCKLAGVDVTRYQDAKETKDNPDTGCWEQWMWCAMGLKPLPYQTTQAMLFAVNVIWSDPKEEPMYPDGTL